MSQITLLEAKAQPQTFNFQGTELSCPISDGHRMVPVKTVCSIIDVQFKTQDSWLKEHPFFSQLYRLDGVVAGDKRTRQMNCLSVFDLYAWLSSIRSDKRREGSLDKQYAFSNQKRMPKQLEINFSQLN